MNEFRAIRGDEPGLTKDPALLNRIAWSCRWQSRRQSVDYARAVHDVLDGEQGTEASVHRALADITLSFQAKWRGAFDEAMEYALRAEPFLPEVRFPEMRSEIYAVMGVVHYSRHRLDLADAAVKRGFSLVNPDMHASVYAELLTVSATIHKYCGDLRSAGETLGQARRIAKGATLARVEQDVARWMLSDDAPAHGLSHAETAISLAEVHQSIVVMPYAHEVAGACLVALGELERAEPHFTTALGFATADDDTRAQCQIIGWFADLENKRQNLERARDLYRYGREISVKMNYIPWETKFARRLAEVYEALGDLENAVECHRRAWKLTDEKRQ